jgi:hypothetical protein
VAVLALVFYAYLGSVVSPEKYLEHLLMALVNEDRGGDLAGTGVKIGDCVVEKCSGTLSRCSVTFLPDASIKRSGKLLRRQGRVLAERLSFAARSDFRAAVSFCKGPP